MPLRDSERWRGKAMMHARRWKYALLLLVPALLSLAWVQAEAQTQPATGKAKVDRLVMGLITPYLDIIYAHGSMAPLTTTSSTIRCLSGSLRSLRTVSINPGSPRAGRWLKTASHGASSY